MGRSWHYRELIVTPRSARRGEKCVDYRCVVCKQPYTAQFITRCLTCGGAIDVFYDLTRVRQHRRGNPIERFWDLLPLAHRNDLVWLGDGNTPCLHARALGRSVGLRRLYLKDETTNPTRTTKDRVVSLGLAYLRQFGIRTFALASSGNISTAYARGVQLQTGFHAHLFVARYFLPRLNYADHPCITTYVVDTDFVQAGNAAVAFTRNRDIVYEGGFFNPARREGLKLAYLEAFDAIKTPPYAVFQAVSSGMGLLGAYKGALEYAVLRAWDTLPRFFAVQQTRCAPMATAFHEGYDRIQPHHVIENPQGLATAILRGNPRRTYPYIHQLALDTNGGILAVDDAAIREARLRLWEYEGIEACYASATAVAAMLEMARAGKLPPTQPILVNVTGADRPPHPVPTTLIAWDATTTPHSPPQHGVAVSPDLRERGRASAPNAFPCARG
ncbi:MAG: pyridoxal-phosphate dependent enzyme [Deltaproteobacteria bacterium]|nr:pyridoxal-phosphate dependent enzyme [Deltaproteobacteria bacterium]